jgi:hypothetical protein
MICNDGMSYVDRLKILKQDKLETTIDLIKTDKIIFQRLLKLELSNEKFSDQFFRSATEWKN